VTCSPTNSAGRTLVGHGIDAGKLLDENAKRFAAKWGKTKPDGRNIELEAWSSWPEFFAESQRAFARRVDDGYERGARARPDGSVPGPTRVALPPWKGSSETRAERVTNPGVGQENISRRAAKTAKNENDLRFSRAARWARRRSLPPLCLFRHRRHCALG
jgi:hypothetical protein